MDRYPILEINQNIIKKNAEIVIERCHAKGIEPFAVIKGFNAEESVTESIIEAGYKYIASSRIPHLKMIKEKYSSIETVSLRIPMLSEISEVVKNSDISLNSELETIRLLNEEAKKQARVHKIILMRDVGDLREGIFDSNEFVDAACYIENNFKNIFLYGIGTNLTCYGSVIPTVENLTMLSEDAEKIEAIIERKLDIVSGGSTSTLPLLLSDDIPQKINNLRIGEAIVISYDLEEFWGCKFDGMSNDGFFLKAEVIEVNEKPTHPVGKLGINCFGATSVYIDRGVRKRAILAIGEFDLGDCNKIIPKDKDIKILGASSDHMIIDIHDCEVDYKLGDIVGFNLKYQTMLFATNSRLINKSVIGLNVNR